MRLNERQFKKLPFILKIKFNYSLTAAVYLLWPCLLMFICRCRSGHPCLYPCKTWPPSRNLLANASSTVNNIFKMMLQGFSPVVVDLSTASDSLSYIHIFMHFFGLHSHVCYETGTTGTLACVGVGGGNSNYRLPHPAADTQMWWCQAALSTVGWQLHSKQ